MTADTVRIAAMHRDAKRAAENWHENFRPVEYSTPFFIGGKWVRVTIGYDAAMNDTMARQVLEDLTSDRSYDA